MASDAHSKKKMKSELSKLNGKLRSGRKWLESQDEYGRSRDIFETERNSEDMISG